MRVIRVFPRRTKATPDDALAFVGEPDTCDLAAEADAVHISVAFTWDIPRAERLARQWRHVAPVTVGGPAVDTRGETFTPGLYLRHGYTITSRGCPNRCWFCAVPKRDGVTRELPIRPGWNVLDDNLLACSEAHIRAVFAMLKRQGRRAQFTGGLEAARLADWHVDLLASLTPRPAVFLAYDTVDDYEPLVAAARKLLAAGFTAASHRLRCYVLCGFPKDTIAAADLRCRDVLALGLTPMAMLWRDRDHVVGRDRRWPGLQREWARPAIVHATRGLV